MKYKFEKLLKFIKDYLRDSIENYRELFILFVEFIIKIVKKSTIKDIRYFVFLRLPEKIKSTREDFNELLNIIWKKTLAPFRDSLHESIEAYRAFIICILEQLINFIKRATIKNFKLFMFDTLKKKIKSTIEDLGVLIVTIYELVKKYLEEHRYEIMKTKIWIFLISSLYLYVGTTFNRELFPPIIPWKDAFICTLEHTTLKIILGIIIISFILGKYLWLYKDIPNEENEKSEKNLTNEDNIENKEGDIANKNNVENENKEGDIVNKNNVENEIKKDNIENKKI